MKKKIITIGIPCYNEEENVEIAYNTIRKYFKQFPRYTFRFLFVNNGSLDKTKEKIQLLIRKDRNVSGVFLSRNFGFEASIAALMQYANGDAVIIIPCDLQDPPELIPQFLKKWEEGYQIVAGKYRNTEDDVITAFLRRAFYFIFKKISNLDIPVNTSEFALLDRKALNAMKALPEKFRFFRGLRVWVGFKAAFVYYHRQKRLRGKSAYTFISYFQYAERGIYGFSYLLLDIMMYGTFFLTGIAAIVVLLYILYHSWFQLSYETLPTVLLALFSLGVFNC